MASIMSKNNKLNDYNMTYRRVWGVIEKYRSIKQMPIDVLATKVHCSNQTVRNRDDKPNALSLEELMRYKDALDIPRIELAEAIVGTKILTINDLRLSRLEG